MKYIADSRRRPKLVQGKRYAAFERDLNTFSAVGLCGLSSFCLAPVAAGFSLTLVDLCGVAALLSAYPVLLLSFRIQLLLTILNLVEGGRYLF